MYKQRENKTLWAGAFFPDRDPKQALYPKDQGARSWLVVLGSFCVLGATFGYVNTFGVFLAYYKTHQLASSSISAINWIGSIQLFCMYFFAPLVAIFFTQGICQGIGLGLIFLPSQAIISHWFQKRRSLALGLSALGSSVGGVIFPVIMRRLLTSSTFETTVQVIGACTTVCLVVANITLATNQPPAEWHQVHMMDHEALKLRPFVFFTIGSTLVMWGVRLYVPIFYLEAFAQSYHFSPDISYYSLAILNGASLFGRLIPNLLGD
ncbi:major facilitator superfamily domain-containing protein [Fusarium sp. MPI-SDFR-AT-0072]|nr:major facilitator superfamily domain-containing protein [Fusarium sp. MPI-SDFR-AT-0072]